MNKILISRDKVLYDKDNTEVLENNIYFLNDGVYNIEYLDIDKVEYSFNIKNLSNVILLESSFSNEIVVNNKYIIDNSKVIINKFYNNKGVKENIDILLYNHGEINYKFSNICENREDYVINIYHNGVGTVSNIINKSLAIDGSKLNFIINSIVPKESIKSKLNQNTRIVTIGDTECKISPNMYIDLDDIEAKHGSVIGTFKDEMVFYLMSRGINYNDSLKLLVKGYLFSNIDVNGEIKDKIFNVIDKYWR